MRRYTKRYRNRSSHVDLDILREQMINELIEESRRILAQMSLQFTKDLQMQASQQLMSIMGERRANASNALNGNSPLGAFSNIAQAATRYLISRPRTSTSSTETPRSAYAEQDFRLSRSQAMAEAASSLNNGEKNS